MKAVQLLGWVLCFGQKMTHPKESLVQKLQTLGLVWLRHSDNNSTATLVFHLLPVVLQEVFNTFPSENTARATRHYTNLSISQSALKEN